MKNLIAFFTFVFLFTNAVNADIPGRIFTKNEIKNLANTYLENTLDFDNPIFVDVDKDGDFDALRLNDGNVEYYKNTGTLDNPAFILEDKHYDSYSLAFFVDPEVPYPLFFADNDGDNDLDLFAVKDKTFNLIENRYNYNITTADNAFDLDTGTLITIILILIIVILVLAILR